jgi:hypothetical protein
MHGQLSSNLFRSSSSSTTGSNPVRWHHYPVAREIHGYFQTYRAFKVVSLFLAGYIALFSYCYVGVLGDAGGFVDPDVGYVIDPNSDERTEAGVILTKGVERAIVASNDFQMVCLGITRASAFFMYPCKYPLQAPIACLLPLLT